MNKKYLVVLGVIAIGILLIGYASYKISRTDVAKSWNNRDVTVEDAVPKPQETETNEVLEEVEEEDPDFCSEDCEPNFNVDEYQKILQKQQ